MIQNSLVVTACINISSSAEDYGCKAVKECFSLGGSPSAVLLILRESTRGASFIIEIWPV